MNSDDGMSVKTMRIGNCAVWRERDLRRARRPVV